MGGSSSSSSSKQQTTNEQVGADGGSLALSGNSNSVDFTNFDPEALEAALSGAFGLGEEAVKSGERQLDSSYDFGSEVVAGAFSLSNGILELAESDREASARQTDQVLQAARVEGAQSLKDLLKTGTIIAGIVGAAIILRKE